MERVPRSLRERIEALDGDYAKLRMNFGVIAECIEREASSRIMKIRTVDGDRKWNNVTGARIRKAAEAKGGISAMASSQSTHSSRGQGIDVRDPQHPIPAAPGGPTLSLDDWANYPESVQNIEKIWGEDDYLYFDDIQDTWYYRITRADLRSEHVDLASFLRPIHEALMALPQYNEAITEGPRIAARGKSVKDEIAERMKSPKQLIDIFQ